MTRNAEQYCAASPCSDDDDDVRMAGRPPSPARKKRRGKAGQWARAGKRSKATKVKALLNGDVRYKCLICGAAKAIAKKSLKQHRRGQMCINAQKQKDHLVRLAQQAPPPLSADAARQAVRNI